MKQALIYSPYFPNHFGGGERYLLQVAQVLAKKYELSLAGLYFDKNAKSKYEDFLGEKLGPKIKFINSPFSQKQGFLKKLFFTRKFDLVYFATDGSFFFSLAKKNILHIQIPFKNNLSFFQKLKLLNWRVKNSNSEFTKKVVEKSWHTKINFVHYPVGLHEFADQNVLNRKEKIILNVGRFFRQLHSKRQDVLVKIFSKLNLKDWQLVLIGNVEDQEYLSDIKKYIRIKKINNIKILNNISRQELLEYYKRASIYWHATGFEVDENQNPEKVEHFGISTPEAMSYGAVPIVINKGGQKEILAGDLEDLLWESELDCLEKTLDLAKNENKLKKYQALVIRKAKEFSKEKFEKTLFEMIER